MRIGMQTAAHWINRGKLSGAEVVTRDVGDILVLYHLLQLLVFSLDHVNCGG